MGTPDYIKTAQNAYNAKFDLIQVKLPKGTKDRIKAIIGSDGSMAAFCVYAILETIDGYEAAERYVNDESQEVPSEESPKKRAEGKGKPPERHDPAVKIADLQAIVDRKRQEQEERKEKLEQEKEKRKEEERSKRSAELREYVERMRSGSGLSMEETALVCGIMQSRDLLEKLLVPEDEERAREDLGDRVYDELVKRAKERRREETKEQERLAEQESDQGPEFMEGLEVQI